MTIDARKGEARCTTQMIELDFLVEVPGLTSWSVDKIPVLKPELIVMDMAGEPVKRKILFKHEKRLHVGMCYVMRLWQEPCGCGKNHADRSGAT